MLVGIYTIYFKRFKLNKVYITEYSSISALGNGNNDTYNNISQNNINITTPKEGEKLSKPYFEVKSIPSDKEVQTKCAAISLELLRHFEPYWTSLSPIPVFIATSTGGIKETEEIYTELVLHSKKYPLGKKQYFYDIYESIKNVYDDKIAESTSLFASACSSAGHALFHAWRFIQNGVIDKALVIGVDALSITTMIGFDALKLISAEGTKPLTLQRDGLTLGEGGGILLLESNPGKKPIAEVVSVHSNTDGFHVTSPNPTGIQQKECILNALEKGNLKPEDIDYINAHGTGTFKNDEIELMVVNQVFNNKPISSLKGFIGHTLGSSAVTEISILLETLKNNKIFIPEFNDVTYMDTNIISKSIDLEVKYFLKNSFGFGGNNVSCIIKNMH